MVADDASSDLEITFLVAILLGALVGFSAFLPVSSTGHLILAVDLLRRDLPLGRVFEVAIQSGAILAVLVVFFSSLRLVVSGTGRDPASWAFLRNTLLIPTVRDADSVRTSQVCQLLIHSLCDVREDQHRGGDHAEGSVGSGSAARGGAGEGRKGVATDARVGACV